MLRSFCSLLRFSGASDCRKQSAADCASAADVSAQSNSTMSENRGISTPEGGYFSLSAERSQACDSKKAGQLDLAR